MRTAIDSAGRVVIPKAIRERAALRPGLPLEVRFADGAVVIEPAPLAIRIERRGRFFVAQPEEKVPALTSAVVEETRRRLRKERGGGD